MNKISKKIVKIFKKKIKLNKVYLHEPDLNKSDSVYLKDCINQNAV